MRLAYRNPKRASRAHEQYRMRILEAIGGDPNRGHIFRTMESTRIKLEAIDYVEGLGNLSEHQFDFYRRSVEAIHHGDLYLVDDPKTGRLFNNFTNLWSDLRPYLRIGGEEVCEIDIANSQPLLAASLYPEGSEERPRYLEVVLEGSFYRELEAASGLKCPDYKKLKKLVFKQVFFGRNGKGANRPLLRAFMNLFPELYLIIQNMKKVHKNRLALKLQSIEAYLVIGKVVDRLRLLGVPCLTVHDSIVCKVSDEEVAYEALDAELEKLIGHRCHIKIKSHARLNAA